MKALHWIDDKMRAVNWLPNLVLWTTALLLLVDDVISTGESIKALEMLATEAGAQVTGRIAVLAEGGAAERHDIKYLAPLPVFNPDGTPKK